MGKMIEEGIEAEHPNIGRMARRKRRWAQNVEKS